MSFHLFTFFPYSRIQLPVPVPYPLLPLLPLLLTPTACFSTLPTFASSYPTPESYCLFQYPTLFSPIFHCPWPLMPVSVPDPLLPLLPLPAPDSDRLFQCLTIFSPFPPLLPTPTACSSTLPSSAASSHLHSLPAPISYPPRVRWHECSSNKDKNIESNIKQKNTIKWEKWDSFIRVSSRNYIIQIYKKGVKYGWDYDVYIIIYDTEPLGADNMRAANGICMVATVKPTETNLQMDAGECRNFLAVEI